MLGDPCQAHEKLVSMVSPRKGNWSESEISFHCKPSLCTFYFFIMSVNYLFKNENNLNNLNFQLEKRGV